MRKRSCKKGDQEKYGIFRYRFLGVDGIFLCIGNEKLIKSKFLDASDFDNLKSKIDNWKENQNNKLYLDKIIIVTV